MENNTLPQIPTETHNPWMVPFSIIIAGALIGGGIYLSSTAPKETIPLRNAGVEIIDVAPLSTEDHILGNPNAPIVIVEFSDSECPFCKQFHVTMKRIMDEYGKDGKVAWVYRHFPIAQLHPLAPKQAEAMECISDLEGEEMFWTFTDRIYARPQGSPPLDTVALSALAKEVGADQGDFDKCLSSGRMAIKVQEDMVDGGKAGVNGTPHSIMITRSGEKIAIKGAQPYDILKSVIDSALQAEGVTEE